MKHMAPRVGQGDANKDGASRKRRSSSMNSALNPGCFWKTSLAKGTRSLVCYRHRFAHRSRLGREWFRVKRQKRKCYSIARRGHQHLGWFPTALCLLQENRHRLARESPDSEAVGGGLWSENQSCRGYHAVRLFTCKSLRPNLNGRALGVVSTGRRPPMAHWLEVLGTERLTGSFQNLLGCTTDGAARSVQRAVCHAVGVSRRKKVQG